jgi:hypothetical protein
MNISKFLRLPVKKSADWEFGGVLSNELPPSSQAIVWKFTAHFWWIPKWLEKRDLKGRARGEQVFLLDAELGL